MSHTRNFVQQIFETIRTGIRSNYSNTQILFGVPRNPNTEYRILFGIEKIRIPNTNTTIWSNYSNSIRIPNYSSHPGTPLPLYRIHMVLFIRHDLINLIAHVGTVSAAKLRVQTKQQKEMSPGGHRLLSEYFQSCDRKQISCPGSVSWPGTDIMVIRRILW